MKQNDLHGAPESRLGPLLANLQDLTIREQAAVGQLQARTVQVQSDLRLVLAAVERLAEPAPETSRPEAPPLTPEAAAPRRQLSWWRIAAVTGAVLALLGCGIFVQRKFLHLESAFAQLEQERVPKLEMLIVQVERRLSAGIAALDGRLQEQHELTRRLQADASRIDRELQKLVAAIETLREPASRNLVPAARSQEQ
jgi:hypothetical protein